MSTPPATVPHRPGQRPDSGRLPFPLSVLLLGGLMIAAAALRLFLLADKSIWLDEAFSIAIGRRSAADTLRLVIQTDTHPPLYYLMLNLWLRLGADESHVRLLSALLSVAAVPLAYHAGKTLYEDGRAGLVAAAIVTFSAFQVWYAQEARMYALLSCLVLASAYFFMQALRRGSLLHWAGFVLATTLALYTDNGAIWYVLAIGLFSLLCHRRFAHRMVAGLAGFLAIGILYLPWVPFLLKQVSQVTESFWIPPPTFQAVLGTFLDFNSFGFPWMAISVLYMVVILVLAYIVPSRGSWQRPLTTLWIFAPIGVSLLLSLRQPIFLSRNLIAASLGYYLLAAGTIWQLKDRRAMAALLFPLIAMNLVSIGRNAWVEEKEDWRAAAAYVAEMAEGRQGGLLLFVPSYAELPFDYYFDQYGLALDTQGFPEDEILLHPRPRRMDDVAATVGNHPYVWLILRDVEAADPGGTVKAWLDNHGYVRSGDLVRDELSVIAYVRWDYAHVPDRPAAARWEDCSGPSTRGPATLRWAGIQRSWTHRTSRATASRLGPPCGMSLRGNR